MSVSEAKKANVIKTYQRGQSDTGSPEVQVALMSDRISLLTEHMKAHKKDLSCRRGLLRLVASRRSLLDYLKKIDNDRYLAIIAKLGLRR
jgi:small subunit ribosomal protein S15